MERIEKYNTIETNLYTQHNMNMHRNVCSAQIDFSKAFIMYRLLYVAHFYLLYCVPSFFQRDLYKGLPKVITFSSSHSYSPSKHFIANLANLSAQQVKACCCFYLFLMLSDKNVNTSHSGTLNQLHICTADYIKHKGTFKWMGNSLKDITVCSPVVSTNGQNLRYEANMRTSGKWLLLDVCFVTCVLQT